jgi:hypothetical protein
MNTELIRAAAKALSLQHLTLGSHTVEIAKSFDPLMEPPATGSMFQWGPREASVDDVMSPEAPESLVARVWRVAFHTRCRIVRLPESGQLPSGYEPPAEDIFADLQATFHVFYQHTIEHKPDTKALDEFAKHNVAVHVWPWWREWLHTTCTRSGLPLVMLNMQLFNAGLAQQKTKETLQNPSTDDAVVTLKAGRHRRPG